MRCGKPAAVEGRPIEDVIAAFAEAIPRKNEMQLRRVIPQRRAAATGSAIYSKTRISTRRFWARPSRVLLSPAGWELPKLNTSIR